MTGAGPTAADSPSPLRVRLRSPGLGAHVRRWDGNTLLFDDVSGDTHIFDPLAGAILACVGADSTAASDVARRLADEVGVPPDETLSRSVDAALRRFAALGLIERVAA
jgi:PqqD family protein of HPr-rel-A system